MIIPHQLLMVPKLLMPQEIGICYNNPLGDDSSWPHSIYGVFMVRQYMP